MIKRRKAFTLIELLVVIAIIAILAAILFPVITRAIAASKAASCSSNLGQIYKAAQMYQDDWMSVGVWRNTGLSWGAGDSSGVRGWIERYYKYQRKLAVFRCPGRPMVQFAYTMDVNILKMPVKPTKRVFVAECPGYSRTNDSIPTATGNTAFGPTAITYGFSTYGYNNELDKRSPYGMNPDHTDLVMAKTDNPIYQYWLPTGQGITGTGANGDKVKQRQEQVASFVYFPGPHNGFSLMVFWDGHVAGFKDMDPGNGVLAADAAWRFDEP